MARVLFVFIDGVGLGSPDAERNPLAAAELPTLARLLGGRALVLDSASAPGPGATLAPLDAVLDIPGTPQSGTGHTALLTGENAARLFGRHFGPWVPTALRPLLAERNLLVRARQLGYDVAFANAYPEEVEAWGTAEPPRHYRRLTTATGPYLAAGAAGLLTRRTPELERGLAVTAEITNEAWRERLGRTSLPRIDAAEAGRNLARIAATHDLTFYAHFATDTAGHGSDPAAAAAAMARVDTFLGGALESLQPGTRVLIASDHGNLEDVRKGHTKNPALGLVAGAGHAAAAAELRSLVDVTPAILRWLGG